MYAENLRHAALLILGSSFLFALMGAMIKTLSTSLSNEMIVFFRNAMGLATLLPWLLRRPWSRFATRHFRLHLTRSLAGLTAMYCFFYGIAHLRLAEATLFNYSTPLFIPLIAFLWLRERIARALWWSITVGFLGILLILKPGLALFQPAALIGLASGLFAAIAMVSIRRLTRVDSATTVVFYFTLISTAVSAIPLLWAWQTPAPQFWLLLLLVGAIATAAQLLLTRGYAHAAPAQVGPFTYATVAFAALLGWAFWGEVPDLLSFLGALLVCTAGILAIRLGAGRPAPAEAVQ